jgi:hypothetical protein
MRLAVIYTMVTDEECRNVPVYLDTGLMDEDEKTPFLVSTKKVFNYVFLTIQAVKSDVFSAG